MKFGKNPLHFNRDMIGLIGFNLSRNPGVRHNFEPFGKPRKMSLADFRE